MEPFRNRLSGRNEVPIHSTIYSVAYCPWRGTLKTTTLLYEEYNKALQKLNLLKAEVIKCLQGESTFSKDILSELITDTEKNCNELAKLLEKLETELKQSEDLQAELCRSYDEIISWADLYDSASIEAKKMIVNSMIKRIDVFRDYKLKIEFNFDIKQFFLGIDKKITFDMTA